MPDVVVTPVEERYLEGYLSVRSLTYGDGLPIPQERQDPRFGIQNYVALVDGEVSGICSVLPMTATRGGALLTNGGVAMVGVSPERRRGGIGKAMMDGLVRELRARGTLLASLYAYREPFYAQSGYASVGKRIRVIVPSHRLPKIESSLPIRRLTPDDWAELAPCHAAYGHARSGVHIRNAEMWKRVLNENRPLTIYAAGDPVEGYVAVSHKIDFWVEQGLSEVIWSTPEGYRACLELIRQVSINKSAAAWFEPSDSPYMAQYMDQGVETKIERTVMFRVNDVPEALRQLKPEDTGEFRLKVIDPVVPENEGPWQISFSPEGVEVTPCSEYDVVMDIRPFTQAFMGEPGILELHRQGLVDGDPREIAKLLPHLPVICGDFF